MTTIAKADKSRLTIRGLVDGHHYVVSEQPGGGLITPLSVRAIIDGGGFLLNEGVDLSL